MFSEFKEYDNPERADYDLKINADKESSTKKNTISPKEKCIRQIIDLVGFLEDGEWINYGITEEEYLNPTAEVVNKIKSELTSNEKDNYKIK